MALNPGERRWARLSLVAVWLWTAVVSLQQANGMGSTLLAAQPAIPRAWYPTLIWGGAVVDLVLGLAMWLRPSRPVYMLAATLMLVMTAVGTWVDPGLWLHPLGPLSKNLPILALLWLLARTPANASATTATPASPSTPPRDPARTSP